MYGSESRLKDSTLWSCFQRVWIFRFGFFFFCELVCPQGLHFYKKNKNKLMLTHRLFCRLSVLKQMIKRKMSRNVRFIDFPHLPRRAVVAQIVIFLQVFFFFFRSLKHLRTNGQNNLSSLWRTTRIKHTCSKKNKIKSSLSFHTNTRL